MKKIVFVNLLVFITTFSGQAQSFFTWDNATVYFLLNDRFYNGDPSRDQYYGGSPTGVKSFQGGDLAGITQKINEGYFSDLGVNAIWFTAPYEQDNNPVGGDHYAYHGYYTLDWTEVDPNMGTKETLREMVDAAHARGIRVIMDVVMNHTGYGSGYPLHTWIRANSGGTDLNTPLAGLPDILTENVSTDVALPNVLLNKWDAAKEGQELAELEEFFTRTGYPRTPRYYLIKWLTDWVREFGIDGFRIDTAKHVELLAWSELKAEAILALREWKANNPTKKLDDLDFYMTGEVFGMGFTKNEYHTQGNFNSTINFDFKNAVVNPNNLENVYAQYAQGLNNDPEFGVLNYISSHDVDLFDRNNLYHGGSALLLAPGAAQIYYGDETGRPFYPGQNDDQRLRLFMNWDDMDTDLLAHWQKVGKFRQNHPAIGAGSHYRLNTSPYTFVREYIGETVYDKVVVVMNASGSTTVELGEIFPANSEVRDAYTGQVATVSDGKVTFTAGSQGLILIESTTALVAPPKLTISPADVVHSDDPVTVTLTATDPVDTNPTIYYTLDGSTPSTDSPVYTAPFTLTEETTVKAIACNDNGACSSVLEKHYHIGEIEGFTVYFYRPDTWENEPNIYYWNTDPAGVLAPVQWPGVSMVDEGDGWYSFFFEDLLSTNLIFNNAASPQTVDLSRNRVGWYYNEVWYNTKPNIGGVVNGLFDDVLKNNFKLFPNPGNDIVTVKYQLPQKGKTSLSICSINGQEITQIHAVSIQQAGDYEEQIDLKPLKLSQGMYLMKLNWEGSVATFKFSIK
ncbi:MAG: alpha-amylase family glycosyl hydrolase [Flammeovirgaceae bacterium]